MANLMLRTWDSNTESYVHSVVAELTPQQVADWLHEDYSDSSTDTDTESTPSEEVKPSFMTEVFIRMFFTEGKRVVSLVSSHLYKNSELHNVINILPKYFIGNKTLIGCYVDDSLISTSVELDVADTIYVVDYDGRVISKGTYAEVKEVLTTFSLGVVNLK